MVYNSYESGALIQRRHPAAIDGLGENYGVYDPQHSYAGSDYADDGFDFWGTLRAITKRKWIIISLLLIGVGLSVFLTLRVEPLYRATATIEVQRQETQIMGGSIDPAVIADDTYMATQYALLKSRALAERVVEVLNLNGSERFVNVDADRVTRTRQATSRVLQNIRVYPEGRSRIVNVQYISTDPREAADIANTVVENFIESNLERKFNTSAYARNFLTERLAQAKKTLEVAERKLVVYAEDEGIFDLPSSAGGQTSLDANAIVALSNELSAATSNRIDTEQAYLAMLGATATTATLDSTDLMRLRATKSELAGEYQELLGTFKPSYPDMLKLKSRIDALDREILEGRDAILVAAQATFKAAKAREESLLTRVETLKKDLQLDRNSRIEYTIFLREVDTARSQYDALLQRLKEVSIEGGVGSSQVSVVDRAIAPNWPFEPNLGRNVVQAAILSLGLGIGLALVLNYIDDKIKTPDDVKTKLRLPAIGVIPKVKGKDNLISDEMENSKSGVSEAYFSARTALEFTTGTGTPKSILVTSTQPSEGKTSSTLALATAFAKIGKSVLIIDADMRKPSFVADADQSVGLSGLLTKPENLIENIIKSKTEGLYLLPSGIIPPNPAELLSGPRLAKIIAAAESHFDLVLVDSPPVMSFADGPILGGACGGALVVVKSGKIRRPAAERTIARLRESRTNVLGVVLMQFEAKKAGYDYDYYYYAYGAGSTSYGARVGSEGSSRRKIELFTEAEEIQEVS